MAKSCDWTFLQLNITWLSLHEFCSSAMYNISPSPLRRDPGLNWNLGEGLVRQGTRRLKLYMCPSLSLSPSLSHTNMHRHTRAHTHSPFLSTLSHQVKHCFELWRNLVSQVLKGKCMEAVGRQTQQNIAGNSSPAPSRPSLKIASVALHMIGFLCFSKRYKVKVVTI